MNDLSTDLGRRLAQAELDAIKMGVWADEHLTFVKVTHEKDYINNQTLVKATFANEGDECHYAITVSGIYKDKNASILKKKLQILNNRLED